MTNWSQIITFAKQMGLPEAKKRGILREYLQTKFIHDLYKVPEASKLSFVGGTSLRLLRNLPRFSEDLDFDNLGLKDEEIRKLFKGVVSAWARENIIGQHIEHTKESGSYAEIRFPDLLYQLKISSNPKEKLMIKLDYADFWTGQETEMILLNRFGYIQQIVTNPKDQLLAQKLTAYVFRKQTQPRDMYDIVWLYSQGARLDRSFLEKNNQQLKNTTAFRTQIVHDESSQKNANTILAKNFGSYVLDESLKKVREEKSLDKYVLRLMPFLFEESESQKILLLEQVLQEMKNEKINE